MSLRVAGEQRWIAADDAGLYRDARRRGAAERAARGVPRRRRRRARQARRPLGAHARPVHDRRGPQRYRVDPSAALGQLERDGDLVRGELRPGGTEREWCDPEVLRRLRRASLAVLRKEVEAVDQHALAAFLPSWQGVDRHPPTGAGIDRLREVLVPLQGLALPADVWERDVLPRRTGAYSPTWLDQLCASGEVVWVGAGLARPQLRPRRAVLPRGRAAARPARATRSSAPSMPEHDLLRERLARSPCFFTDLLAELDLAPEMLQEALWDLVWAGEVTNDAFAPLRAPRLTLARARPQTARSRAAPLRLAPRRGAQAPVQGRWSLTTSLFAGAPPTPIRARAAARGPSCCSSATASSPASRSSPRASPAASRSSTTRSASSRRSASRAAATSSRASAARSSRCPARSSGCARSATPTASRRSCSPPPTPRSPTARRCRGRSAMTRSKRPQRAAGAYVVLAGAEPVLYVERGGRGLVAMVDRDDERLRPALEALADFVKAGRIKKLDLERTDDLDDLLVELGFRQGPRKLTLTA